MLRGDHEWEKMRLRRKKTKENKEKRRWKRKREGRRRRKGWVAVVEKEMVKAYFLMDGGDEKMKFDDSDWLSKNGYKWA